MKVLIASLSLLLITQLIGCVGVSINTATLAARAAPRDELRPLAEAGDSAAQYELGKSYCCMGMGFDTQTATEWLCKAAHQGNVDAMFELGRIYRGQVSRTAAPGQRLRGALMAKEFPAYAHLWLSMATSVDFPEAAEQLADLNSKIADTALARSIELQESWREVPCEYEAVLASVGG